MVAGIENYLISKKLTAKERSVTIFLQFLFFPFFAFLEIPDFISFKAEN